MLKDSAPDRYQVTRGDTLWGISARFLKDPWRWPELWNMNREQVKNPHRIYPGEVLVLDRSGESPQLRVENAAPELETVDLSPSIQVEETETSAIPSIPYSSIAPFLSRAMIMADDALKNAPEIVGAADGRLALGVGDRIYASGITPDSPLRWQIVRRGKALLDPENGQPLGQEIEYLGRAKVMAHTDPAALEITGAASDIRRGDLLLPMPAEETPRYVPHAPSQEVEGRIISLRGGISAAGALDVVAINRGSESGLETGSVLAVYGKETPSRLSPAAVVSSERSALLFVFRVFEKVSYGLIMQASRPVHLLDTVKNP